MLLPHLKMNATTFYIFLTKMLVEFSYLVLAFWDNGAHTENSIDTLSSLHPAKWSQDWPKSLTGKINSKDKFTNQNKPKSLPTKKGKDENFPK